MDFIKSNLRTILLVPIIVFMTAVTVIHYTKMEPKHDGLPGFNPNPLTQGVNIFWRVTIKIDGFKEVQLENAEIVSLLEGNENAFKADPYKCIVEHELNGDVESLYPVCQKEGEEPKALRKVMCDAGDPKSKDEFEYELNSGAKLIIHCRTYQ